MKHFWLKIVTAVLATLALNRFDRQATVVVLTLQKWIACPAHYVSR